MSAKSVDTTIIAAAVVTSVIGAGALLIVLIQAWMGFEPSHVLTYLPMILLPFSFILMGVTIIRAAYRRRATEAGRI